MRKAEFQKIKKHIEELCGSDLVDVEILKKFYDRAYRHGYDDRYYGNSYNSRDYRAAEEIAPIIAKIRGGREKRSAALAKLEAEL